MNKFLVTSAMVAGIAVASQASASTVRGEVVFADFGSRSNQTEYKISYNDHVFGRFNGGVEITTRQAGTQGDVNSSIVGNISTPVQVGYGVTVTPRVELGETFQRNDNYTFYGVEAVATRPLVGPVSVNVGVRYRNGFENRKQNETRLALGAEYSVTERYSLGVTYYNTSGSRSSNTVGVSARARF